MVVGPLLFINFINGIASKVDVSSNINLFVDDTIFFSQSNTTLQNSLNKIYNCLKEIKIDPNKCQSLNIQKILLSQFLT